MVAGPAYTNKTDWPDNSLKSWSVLRTIHCFSLKVIATIPLIMWVLSQASVGFKSQEIWCNSRRLLPQSRFLRMDDGNMLCDLLVMYE
jgi:hypothetical protein